MTINSVNPLWNEMPLQQPQAQTKQENPGVSFADIFRSAINEVAEAQNQVANAEYLLTTGQLDNPAYATIAIAKAELSVSMLAQLRTKALDAYNELMRISMHCSTLCRGAARHLLKKSRKRNIPNMILPVHASLPKIG